MYIVNIEPTRVIIKINPDTNKSNLNDQFKKKYSNFKIGQKYRGKSLSKYNKLINKYTLKQKDEHINNVFNIYRDFMLFLLPKN